MDEIIEEELWSDELEVVFNPLESIREDEDTATAVYVVVWGKHNDEASRSSMDALLWTLNNHPHTLVFLLHIYPEIKYIPTPLGKMPINQVNPEQKEIFMSQERGKRRDFLQKFLNLCSASQVKVDTILVESEMEAKAILDLIPILNITKLVIGATKSTVRRIRSRKGNGVADQIVQSAPDYCEVSIICDGQQISAVESPPSPSPGALDPTPTIDSHSSACGCFKI
ncbi:hypothetical protein ACS0TY_033514 [Phlomoides rotata]